MGLIINWRMLLSCTIIIIQLTLLVTSWALYVAAAAAFNSFSPPWTCRRAFNRHPPPTTTSLLSPDKTFSSHFCCYSHLQLHSFPFTPPQPSSTTPPQQPLCQLNSCRHKTAPQQQMLLLLLLLCYSFGYCVGNTN